MKKDTSIETLFRNLPRDLSNIVKEMVCVEKIAGLNPEPIDYNNIPGCTYTNPEVSSLGLTEEKAKEAGYEIKIGKFPYSASGKASAAGQKDGFIKLILVLK